MSDDQQKQTGAKNYKLHAFIAFQAVLFATIFFAFFGNPFANVHEGMLDMNLQNSNTTLSTELNSRSNNMQFDH